MPKMTNCLSKFIGISDAHMKTETCSNQWSSFQELRVTKSIEKAFN